jgi:hypothetical protein
MGWKAESETERLMARQVEVEQESTEEGKEKRNTKIAGMHSTKGNPPIPDVSPPFFSTKASKARALTLLTQFDSRRWVVCCLCLGLRSHLAGLGYVDLFGSPIVKHDDDDGHDHVMCCSAAAASSSSPAAIRARTAAASVASMRVRCSL